MKRTYGRRNDQGFGLLGVLAIAVVIAALGAGGWLAWHAKHTAKKSGNTVATKTAVGDQKKAPNPPAPQPTPVDPYAGWVTHCEPTNSACIKYPSDWVPAQYGGYENAAGTAFAALGVGNNKDGGAETAYVYSVTSLPPPVAPVDIVGFIVNNQPGYELFASSYVAAAGITAGSTQQLADINYVFKGKQGEVSLITSPGANGFAAITNLNEAKAWFNTSEGQTCLKIMQSFYYD